MTNYIVYEMDQPGPVLTLFRILQAKWRKQMLSTQHMIFLHLFQCYFNLFISIVDYNTNGMVGYSVVFK